MEDKTMFYRLTQWRNETTGGPKEIFVWGPRHPSLV